ncbi:MAG: ribokinase [Marinosulfonomonas sp.]|nr:ribokinase [Marinosulfonomonas sp.]
MGNIVVLGVFVADTTFRAKRMPRMGETILGKSFSLGPGGKGSNQAVAAARMGADVSILTKLGKDDFAKMALQLWADAGVTPHIEQLADSYTGAANIFIQDASGDNAIIVAPGAAATISAADMDKAGGIIRAASVFITQLEQPMAAAMRALEIAKEAGVTTILNPAPSAELPKGMLALCDYVTPNETEACDLTGVAVASVEQAGEASEILQDQGVGTPIITLGERGAYLHGHGLVPAVNAGPVVETTGAGDAFNGAFASQLAAGENPVQAVRFGCAAAGISVTRPGAAASMPTRAEVLALMGG